MKKGLQKKSVRVDIFDALKSRVIDFGVDYVKKNFSLSTDEVAKHVERYLRRKIERRVRHEVRKQVFKYMFLLLLVLGISFLTYFLFDLIVIILDVPDVMTNLFFGLFLLFVSLFLYIIK